LSNTTKRDIINTTSADPSGDRREKVSIIMTHTEARQQLVDITDMHTQLRADERKSIIAKLDKLIADGTECYWYNNHVIYQTRRPDGQLDASWEIPGNGTTDSIASVISHTDYTTRVHCGAERITAD